MNLTFDKGIKNENDLEQIHLLDTFTYEEKYLLTLEEYKKRLNKNPNQIFIVRNKKKILVGYTSMVPLKREDYEKIKSGETDKEVIIADNILSEKENIEYIYWDSIIINPKYRKYKIGNKLVGFALKELKNDNPNLKKIMGHVISKGGVNIAQKYGLQIKKSLDSNTVVVEKVLNRKSNIKKKLYKNNEKRILEKKRKNKINYIENIEG